MEKENKFNNYLLPKTTFSLEEMNNKLSEFSTTISDSFANSLTFANNVSLFSNAVMLDETLNSSFKSIESFSDNFKNSINSLTNISYGDINTAITSNTELQASSNALYNYIKKTDFPIFYDLDSTNTIISRINKLSIKPIITANNEDHSKDKRSIQEIQEGLSILDIITSISENEAINFYDFITEHFMLGLNHSVGKKISQFIKNHKHIEINNIKLYRGRINPKNQDRFLAKKEMWAPPEEKASQSRFNFFGESVLYTSDKKDGVIDELGITDNVNHRIIEINLIKNLTLLDLTETKCPIFNSCLQRSDSNTSFKIEYVIPNFFAQCCKLHRINGIKYRSTMNDEAINYAIFNHSKDWFEDSANNLNS